MKHKNKYNNARLLQVSIKSDKINILIQVNCFNNASAVGTDEYF